MHRPILGLATLALLAAGSAQAATFTWPGAAPCNTTLQACINNAASGDTVRIATNDVIHEDLAIHDKSLTLEAAGIFSPRLGPGRGIGGLAGVAGDIEVTLRGLTLQDGLVEFNRTGSGNGRYQIERMTLLSTSNASSTRLRVVGNNTGTLDVRIHHNFIETGSDFITAPGIDVQSRGPSTGASIAYNRVTAPRGSASYGIRAFTEVGGNLTLVIFANEVRGHLGQGAIRVSALAGPLSADVINNVVVGGRSGGSSDSTDGISLIVGNANMGAFVYNNTVVDTGGGIALFRAAGSTQEFGGTVRNNLIAFNQNGLRMLPGTGSVSNGSNLVHGNQSNAFTPGPGTVTADPMLRGLHEPRPVGMSPAIDAGDTDSLRSNLSFIGWPFVDADGRRRFVQLMGPEVVDIGAYEFGDRTFLARSPPTVSNWFTASHPALDGMISARPQLAKVFNPFGFPSVNNVTAIGFWYCGDRWCPFNQNLAPMPTGAAFNVFAPGAGNLEGARFAHVANAGNITGNVTTLDHPFLNTRNDAILLVTPNWDNGVYLNHNFAVGYTCPGAPGPNCWSIVNLDLAAMPSNASFNVYAQDPSHNAYVHVATDGNISGSATVLDHPLLNGRRCARFHATQKIGTVFFNDSPFDLFYNGALERWTIFNQSGAAMPAGAHYYVVVDAGAPDSCSLTMFSDGFEATMP
ncbi:MAG TPA: hypothetical protein PKZ76_11980 [Xanthomonadaceae bacterium]|nr:hypothetical protein [Xanthomonadaceae bacterium]